MQYLLNKLLRIITITKKQKKTSLANELQSLYLSLKNVQNEWDKLSCEAKKTLENIT